MSEKKLIKKIKGFLEKHGRKVYEISKKKILDEKIEQKSINNALKYFINEFWRDVQNPALLSLACEAVGGKPEYTTDVGVSLVLLRGAADIHDDIIDQSKIKGSKPTVFGKFGKDIAILTGDALLLKGLTLLYEACENFPEKQRKKIIKLVKEAFFKIGIAEAREVDLKGNWNLTPEEYLDIIRMKAAVTEITFRIGAILGGGSSEEVKALSRYGRALGILMLIREEFVDIFEPDELKNRVDHECLPLPILYALRNQNMRNKIVHLLRKKEITEKDTFKIVQNILAMKEIQNLRRKMQSFLEEGIESLNFIKQSKVSELLKAILYATVEDL